MLGFSWENTIFRPFSLFLLGKTLFSGVGVGVGAGVGVDVVVVVAAANVILAVLVDVVLVVVVVVGSTCVCRRAGCVDFFAGMC